MTEEWRALTVPLVKNPPEYRRHRQVVLVLYIVLAGFICICAAISTYHGARARSGIAGPPAAKETVGAVALGWCMRELDELSTELGNRLGATFTAWPARRSSVEWDDWSIAWRDRLLAVGARCRLSQGDVPGTHDLQVAYQRLAKLHRHYTTLAVQYAKEIGPHADGLRQAMEQARRSMDPALEPNKP